MNAVSPEQRLVDFINLELLEDGLTVDELTPLFQEGWIDSLKILHLIAFIEVERGADIPDREIVMDRFQNVRTICAHFLNSTPAQNL